MMGDKINSKKIAKEVNVQTIPGVEKAIRSTEEAKGSCKQNRISCYDKSI